MERTSDCQLKIRISGMRPIQSACSGQAETRHEACHRAATYSGQVQLGAPRITAREGERYVVWIHGLPMQWYRWLVQCAISRQQRRKSRDKERKGHKSKPSLTVHSIRKTHGCMRRRDTFKEVRYREGGCRKVGRMAKENWCKAQVLLRFFFGVLGFGCVLRLRLEPPDVSISCVISLESSGIGSLGGW